tara:strand:- start:3437 stop:3721 length:285 start_codon:yes stop_codon:yes gene_type:complete
MDSLPLPPFTYYERQSGYVEHIFHMYNKQYRELGYMYCRFHNDIVKSHSSNSCIKCQMIGLEKCKKFMEEKMGCKLTDEEFLAIGEAQKDLYGH